jgi:Tfp pilus assembly protein PilN
VINLLPSDYGASLRHSHLNTILSRWLVAATMACAGLVLILAVGWVYINQQNKNLTKNINSVKQQLQTEDLTGTQKKAKDITNNIRIIDQVLSREIRFSGLITQIGSVMPPGTVLSGLTLTKIDGGLDLSASARDYTSATQIAVNLSDPKNKIFDKVDIVSINCATTPGNSYPCSASFRALFSKSTKEQFLNVPGAKS